MSALLKKPPASIDNEKNWNRRILIVDDEKDILSIYDKLLSSKPKTNQLRSSRQSQTSDFNDITTHSYELVKCTSFDEAMSAMMQADADHKPFAMGFFDVRLGEQRDGVELAAEAKKLDPHMGVVFVTAYNDRSLDSIASTLGDSINDQWDFMNKPFNENEIIQKARSLTALWNLRFERNHQEVLLADLNRRVIESERITSVAAVARGVTHEFGNLLMQIIGKAEMSLNKKESEMKEAFDRIIDAGMRASEILDRFNHLSDNKSVKSEKSLVSIGNMIHGSLDLMEHLFKKNSIDVVVEFSGNESLELVLHNTSMLQVFVNLFINASHAMEGQKNKRIFCKVMDSQQNITIEICDNGPGVSPELLERLTEPLFTTKGKKGTGLGLAICKEIIEIDHQGEFQISNLETGGFKVLMTLNKGG